MLVPAAPEVVELRRSRRSIGSRSSAESTFHMGRVVAPAHGRVAHSGNAVGVVERASKEGPPGGLDCANLDCVRRVALWFGLLLVLAVTSPGCFRAPIPMTSVRDDALPAGSARCLIVLLPGMGDDAEDFRKKGFLDTIRKANLSADVVSTNATFGYYMKGMMPERMFVDVVTPAQRARSYEQTWLVGVSMGGLGALLSAQHHGAEVSGVIAIAPYLGRDKVLDAIRAAGGLDAWVPPPKATPTEDNYDAQLWRFLKAALNGQEASPPIYLGWGKEDRLREADALLAAKLPRITSSRPKADTIGARGKRSCRACFARRRLLRRARRSDNESAGMLFGDIGQASRLVPELREPADGERGGNSWSRSPPGGGTKCDGRVSASRAEGGRSKAARSGDILSFGEVARASRPTSWLFFERSSSPVVS